MQSSRPRTLVMISDVTDVAVNELRAAVQRSSTVDLSIEPSVMVHPFSPLNAAFHLRLLVDSYPSDSIFLIVVNAERRRPERLAVQLATGQTVLTANTGSLSWTASDLGVSEAVELFDAGWLPFGGKQVYAPLCGQIAQGVPIGRLGNPFPVSSLTELTIPDGTVVHVDNFGLIKFKGPIPPIDIGDSAIMTVDNHEVVVKRVDRMMNEPTGSWTVYPGSSLGLPEVGRVRLNGAEELNIIPGSHLEFASID